MKTEIERRQPEGPKDYFAIALSTFGVGYLPLAPGTWGSAVGVLIYLGVATLASIWLHHWGPEHSFSSGAATAVLSAVIVVLLLLLTLAGIWAAGRTTELFGDSDPSYAVVDEIVGQLITFLFIPFTLSWPLIAAGFLLFRLFDIWKPYPIDTLQDLPGGIGICADDILAGVYAGVCLAVIYAVSVSL